MELVEEYCPAQDRTTCMVCVVDMCEVGLSPCFDSLSSSGVPLRGACISSRTQSSSPQVCAMAVCIRVLWRFLACMADDIGRRSLGCGSCRLVPKYPSPCGADMQISVLVSSHRALHALRVGGQRSACRRDRRGRRSCPIGVSPSAGKLATHKGGSAVGALMGGWLPMASLRPEARRPNSTWAPGSACRQPHSHRFVRSLCVSVCVRISLSTRCA